MASISSDFLRIRAAEARRTLLQMIISAGGGHTGGSLSVVDVLVVLYHAVLHCSLQTVDRPDRDYFVLSKGHSVEALYAVLAQVGFLTSGDLESFGRFESKLYGHPTTKIPGVELATGALGHGLSATLGMALAARRLGRRSRGFCVLGDGELAEGSVWEAAMAASHFGLGNLVAIIDYNHLQISGDVHQVMNPGGISDRWTAFGWQVSGCDGNDVEALVRCFQQLDYANETPKLIVASTRKGAGISFMENRPEWHHKLPSAEEAERAFIEIDAALAAIRVDSAGEGSK